MTDANGCVASQSATINQPAAMVLQTATNPANCGSSNGSASVVANGGSSPYSYSWSPGSSSSANATNLPAGAYVVTVTDANGCSNNTTVTQDVSACTGIATLSNDASINVYPNPNNGLFVIELTSASKVSVMQALHNMLVVLVVAMVLEQ